MNFSHEDYGHYEMEEDELVVEIPKYEKTFLLHYTIQVVDNQDTSIVHHNCFLKPNDSMATLYAQATANVNNINGDLQVYITRAREGRRCMHDLLTMDDHHEPLVKLPSLSNVL
ncbi:hypothetical protein GGI21_002927, partial [Coemansia aciculifera]